MVVQSLFRAAARRVGNGVRALRGDRHAAAVAAITLFFAALYATAGLAQHIGFHTALFDLGIYDQALQGYARFGLPRVAIFGLVDESQLGRLHWTDHFTPILAILTPFYWIHRGPETLLVAEGVLFALAIPPVWIFTRRALGIVPAYLVALAFALSWPLQEAVWFPFHQVAFAVPLTALALERYQAGRYRQAAAAALCLLGVREDLGLVVSALGALIALKGERRLGLALLIVGPLATFFLMNVAIPLMGGSPGRNWSHTHFGRNPFELVFAILKSPLEAAEYALSPAQKVRTLLWLFAPTLFFALMSRLLWLALPLLAVRFLSEKSVYTSLHFHYNAFIVATIFCAAVDGARGIPNFTLPLARFGRRDLQVRSGTLWAALVFGVCLLSLPRFPAWNMTKRSFWYPRTAAALAAETAVAQIPDHAFVAASNSVGAHLTRRAKVTLLVPSGNPMEKELIYRLSGFAWHHVETRKKVEAPWVLADVARHQFPFDSVEQQAAQVKSLVDKGYAVIYEADGYVVLFRDDESAPPAPKS